MRNHCPSLYLLIEASFVLPTVYFAESFVQIQGAVPVFLENVSFRQPKLIIVLTFITGEYEKNYVMLSTTYILQESVHFVKYRRAENQLVVFADDTYPR